MTATITPVAKHTGATITRPVDGEGAYMDGGTAPLATILQTLADRAQYARGSAWGNLIGGDEFSVDPGGTSTVFAVRVNAFEAITISDSSTVFWPVFTSADTVWTLADVEGSPANLANSTWYYCYLTVNTSGVLGRQISTTAPNGSRKWKSTGIDTHRYIGCFRTTATGAPIAVRAVRGRYYYALSDLGATSLRVLTGGGATSYTDVDLSSLVPLHSRMAELNVYLAPNTAVSTAIGGATLRRKGGTVGGVIGINCGTGAQWPSAERAVWLETDTSQDIQYRVSTSTGSDYPSLYLDVLGFVE